MGKADIGVTMWGHLRALSRMDTASTADSNTFIHPWSIDIEDAMLCGPGYILGVLGEADGFGVNGHEAS